MAILAECSICHKKQSLRNRICKCGEDLIKSKKSNRLSYWITYRFPGGKQKWERIGSSIELAKDAEGKRRVQKREKRIFEILPEANMTFQELTNWYLNQESVKAKKYYWVLSFSLKTFNKEFGNRIVADIKTSELENYQAKRRNEGKSFSTIDREIISAKAVIYKAFKDNKVSGEVLKVFQNIKKLLKRNSNARKRTLSPEEYLNLESSAPNHLRPILRLGYDTGMREGEVLGLKWGRISLKEKIIRLKPEDTKDNEPRDIPMSEEVFKILSHIPRGISDDYHVFIYKGKPIKDIRSGLKIACKKAGIIYGRFKDNGFIFHDLRRTFVTDMRRAGVPESVIMEITGHSRGEVIDRYNQVTLDDKREAIEKLSIFRKLSENVYKTFTKPPFGIEKGGAQYQLTP